MDAECLCDRYEFEVGKTTKALLNSENMQTVGVRPPMLAAPFRKFPVTQPERSAYVCDVRARAILPVDVRWWRDSLLGRRHEESVL